MSAALQPADYAVLGCHAALSVAVGLFAGRKKASSKDYFVGGRKMGQTTIAVSLISGICSGISYLGVPGYTFTDGLGFLFSALNYVFACGFAAYAIVPFFHRLGLYTAYEYLELRFSRGVRTAAAAVFVLRVLLYLSIVLCAPAIVLDTLTPLPAWAAILVSGSIATVYTIKGGMLAVVWTDFLQSLVMVLFAIVAIIVITVKVDGGVSGVFGTMHNTSRLVDGAFFEVHVTTPPREDFWSMVIGYTFLSLGQLATDQIAVQRYMSAASEHACRRAVQLNGLVQSLFTVLLCYIGFALYAFYRQHDAVDPVASGAIDSADALFPYFTLTEMPQGLAGLLIAAVLGSSMSVFAGGVNAAATCIYVDIVSNALQRPSAPSKAVGTTRNISFVLSVVAIGCSFLASQYHGLVKLGAIATAMCSPLLGVFLLGLFFERAAPRGTMIGFALGLIVVVYLAAASIACSENCEGILAVADINTFWLGLIGCTVTVVCGLLCSLALPTVQPEFLVGLTFWTRSHAGLHSYRQEDRAVAEHEVASLVN